MRAALVLALLLIPVAPARAAIRPAQAEIVVEDARDPGQASLDLELMDGGRIAFHLACRGDGRVLECTLSRRGKPVGSLKFDPNRALTAGGARQATCRGEGVLLTLSVSDLVQTLPAPIADSYRYRVSAMASGGGAAPACR